MIAIRQIHEQLANVIEVPAELRNRRTEVIFLAIDAVDGPTLLFMMDSPLTDDGTLDFVRDHGLDKMLQSSLLTPRFHSNACMGTAHPPY